MSFESRFAVIVSLVITIAIGFAANGQVPDSVSPGAEDKIATIEGRCPSFRWGVMPGAELYHPVCYRLPEGMEPTEVDLSRAHEVLYREVPGGATSWTPARPSSGCHSDSWQPALRAVRRTSRCCLSDDSRRAYPLPRAGSRTGGGGGWAGSCGPRDVLGRLPAGL